MHFGEAAGTVAPLDSMSGLGSRVPSPVPSYISHCCLSADDELGDDGKPKNEINLHTPLCLVPLSSFPSSAIYWDLLCKGS